MGFKKTLVADYVPISGARLATFLVLEDYADLSAEEKAELADLSLAALADMEAYRHRDSGEYDYVWSFADFGHEKVCLPAVWNVDTGSLSVEYKNVAGTWTALLKDTDYYLDEMAGRTLVAWNDISGFSLGAFEEAVRIKFKAGYAVDTLPKNLERGMMLWVRNVWDGLDDDVRRNTAVERLWNAGRLYGA